MRALLLSALLAACAGESTPTPAPAPAPAASKAPAPAAEAPVAAAPAATAAAPAPAAGAAAPGDAAAGEAIYTQYCVACHQADGSGMNGMLAGNFVADKQRLAKSDDELLASIRDGVTGKIGTMPPWGATLSEEDMRNVLAHIRAAYGG